MDANKYVYNIDQSRLNSEICRSEQLLWRGVVSGLCILSVVVTKVPLFVLASKYWEALIVRAGSISDLSNLSKLFCSLHL